MRRLSSTFYIYNIITLLFFGLLLAMNILVNTGLLVASWYLIAGFIFLLGAYLCARNFSFDVSIFVLLCAASSIICYRVNHNLVLTQYLYLVMCPIIGFAMADPRVHSETMKYVLFLYALYIFFSFLLGGITSQVFMTSSTNFVSVFLLYPTVLYYTKVENEGRKIQLYPIVLVWVLCIFARGRGGILTTTFLLIAIFLRVYKEQLKDKKNRIIVGCVLVLIIIVAIFFLIATSTTWLQWGAFEYFNDRGLESKSRFQIWGEYIEAIQRNPAYFLYGVPFTDLKLQVTKIHNNMHNSFFNIHVYNGIVMLLAVIVFLVKACCYSIRNKRYIYLACLMTFCMRAFTDMVFWGNYGTPVFFALLFFPSNANQKRQLLLIQLRSTLVSERRDIKLT